MALLPQHWRKDLSRATGDVMIRIDVNDGTTTEQIRAEAAQVLTDPAVGNWEIVACDTLANSNRHSKDENQ